MLIAGLLLCGSLSAGRASEEDDALESILAEQSTDSAPATAPLPALTRPSAGQFDLPTSGLNPVFPLDDSSADGSSSIDRTPVEDSMSSAGQAEKSTEPVALSEPSSMALLFVGLIFFFFVARRRRTPGQA